MSSSEIIPVKMEAVEAGGKEEFCEYCGSTFANQFILKKHIDNVHIDKHLCQICKVTLQTKTDLIQHLKRDHSQLKPFVCEICNSAHPFENKLNEHIQRFHEKLKPFKCEICPWAFGRVSSLNKHRRYVHEKERRFECPHCHRKIARREDLVNHIKMVHERLRPFPCDNCEYVCGTTFNLRTHKRLMHSNLRAELPCSECGKLFKTKDKVKLHIKFVHGSEKRPYKEKIIKVEQSDNETTDVSVEPKEVLLNNTSEVPMDLDKEMNLLGDLVNDYNMTDELGKTLEYIKTIKCSNNYKPTLTKNDDDQPKIKKAKPKDLSNDNIRHPKMSYSKPGFVDSDFDSFYNPMIASTLQNPITRAKSKNKKSAMISATESESTSNILEIYSSSTTKEPITNQQWIKVEKLIIDQLTTEIRTGAISPMQVKISNSGYVDNKKMGFIQAKDAESKVWYQRKVANLTLDGISFRAWSEHENPEFYYLWLSVPGKLDSIKEDEILSLLVSFNPQLTTTQIKVQKFEAVENVGRIFYLEMSKDAFDFIEENNLILDFVMGEVKLAKDSESFDF